MNEAQCKNYVLFYITSFIFVKTSVVFTREKLRTFLHYVIRFCKNFSGFYKGKTTDFFTVKTTYFFTKNYGLFYKGKTTYFFTKNYVLFLHGKTTYFFYREKLRTFLQGKNYVLFYMEKLRTFY